MGEIGISCYRMSCFLFKKSHRAPLGSHLSNSYGRRPRVVLDLAKESWEQQPSQYHNIIEYVEQMHDRMTNIWPVVREHMQQAQQQQALVYNRGPQVQEFHPGERVLVLIPSSECKFLARWLGPYEVVERTGPVNYRVRQPGGRKVQQIYHVNLLKPWHEPIPSPSDVFVAGVNGPVTPEVRMGSQVSPGRGKSCENWYGGTVMYSLSSRGRLL